MLPEAGSCPGRGRCRCPAAAAVGMRGESTVKKLLVVLGAAITGFAVWRKIEADKAEQALWAEVTDPVK